VRYITWKKLQYRGSQYPSGEVDERAPLDEQQITAQCSQQSTEEHSHATSIPAHECGHELEGKKLSRKILIRAEAKPEISQKDKSVMSMEYETDNTALEDEATRRANVQ